MTTAPQPNRPADTSTTVAELATILDTVALIRFTEPRDARSGRTTDAMTHWLTGVNRVSQIPTRDGTPQYEIANSGFSRHLPGDHAIDVWLTPEPTPAPAPYAAPPVQQYAAAPQQQYAQPAAPAVPQPAAQPQPQYVPQPAAPQAPGERAAAPWMTPQPQAPTPQPQAPAAPQPTAPGYPAQGHYPQQPQQQGSAAPGMR
ncbi:hypothetical protein AB0942_09870 [Streptomyces nodosus]|uniref:hypothetical protein n=1 Tax=Streptomyces nodosus TaxID=40318 RepID=UPI003452F6CA